MRIRKHANKIIGWLFIFLVVLTIVKVIVLGKPLGGFDIVLYVLLQLLYGMEKLSNDE
ncbi:hypothetical protein [Enterococcus phage ECP3]|uniref:Transmembrane protein n=3 Tax=Kochikohdavirus TaxID=2560160 RepID=A0A7T3JEG8_9CAUD|nr:hypothetical protein [Enterococcus phage ECP3]AII28509.1 hypothetical protein [Enterococcus phage ECP3]QPW37348.1 hypothetical protein [Enterococcus phage PBEF129]